MATQRRQPKQERSRQRVEQIMAAAEKLISESGGEGLTIKAIAERTEMPVATIYRYFADRDEICAAYLGHEMEKIDTAIANAFRERKTVSLRSMFTTSMFAHLRHHRENPAGVKLWFGAPRGPVVEEYVDRMDERMATWIHEAVEATGMVRADTPPYRHELFTRLADRTLEFILRSEMDEAEQDMTAWMFCDAIASYFERFATDAGLNGVPAEEFLKALGQHPVHFDAGESESADD